MLTIGPGGLAVLGAEHVRQDLELLHRVRREAPARGWKDVALLADAVDDVAGAAGVAAGRRHAARAPLRGDARREGQQRQVVPPGHRQFFELLGVDRRAQRRLRHLDERRFARDRDRLLHRHELQLKVDRGFLADGEWDARLVDGREAGKLGRNLIRAGRQRDDAVVPARVGYRGPGEACFLVAGRHGCARKHGFRLVGDLSLDERRGDLGVKDRSREGDRERGGTHEAD